MTTGHDRMHMSYCPDLGACVGIGGRGNRDKCRKFDERLSHAEDDRAHAEAEKLRKIAADMVFDLLDPFSPQKEGWVRHIADLIDPYELRDGFWVHKVTGRVVLTEKVDKETP
jgi:hypothetical protein